MAIFGAISILTLILQTKQTDRPSRGIRHAKRKFVSLTIYLVYPFFCYFFSGLFGFDLHNSFEVKFIIRFVTKDQCFAFGKK